MQFSSKLSPVYGVANYLVLFLEWNQCNCSIFLFLYFIHSTVYIWLSFSFQKFIYISYLYVTNGQMHIDKTLQKVLSQCNCTYGGIKIFTCVLPMSGTDGSFSTHCAK